MAPMGLSYNTTSLNSREQEAPWMHIQRQKACKPAAHARV